MAYYHQSQNIEEEEVEPTTPRPGKVNEVRQQWAEKEDGCLAYNLQSKEYLDHFGRNRHTRQTVRDDIPVAKLVQSEEEERRQREKMEMLHRHKQIADNDAVLAAKLMSDDNQKRQTQERRIVEDNLYAECLQNRDMHQRHVEDDIAAQNILCAELLQDNQQRKQTELDDEQMAIALQKKERERYERKKRERELVKERRRLESAQLERSNAADVMVAGYRRENLGGVRQGVEQMQVERKSDKLLRSDGKVEDLGDFSDFYIQPGREMLAHEKKQLQELQDEELARLVQDQEHKRGAQPDRGMQAIIEKTDGEIAKVMQEQEKLKARRKKKKVPTATLR